jgi:hypothetical protein
VCNSRHASVMFTLLNVHLDTTRRSLAWRVMLAPQLDIPLQPIATIWFMSLFVHVLPLHVLEHMWDVFFLEGPKIMFRCLPPSPYVEFGKCDHQPFLIFRIALSIIKVKERSLLQMTTFEDAYQCLMKPEVFSPPVYKSEPLIHQQSNGGLDALVPTAFDHWLLGFRCMATALYPAVRSNPAQLGPHCEAAESCAR